LIPSKISNITSGNIIHRKLTLVSKEKALEGEEKPKEDH